MTVTELLEYFKGSQKPLISAAAALGIHPATILAWEKAGGEVPRQWDALFNSIKKDDGNERIV